MRAGKLNMPSNANNILAHRRMIEETAQKLNMEINFITPQGEAEE
jgi:hypothetical protein